jgi:hypothetical protein
MPLVEIIICEQTSCGGCGADLSGAVVSGVKRWQGIDVRPPPPPHVTGYQIRTRNCPDRAASSTADGPTTVPRRRSTGPGFWSGRGVAVRTTCP